MIYIFDTNSFSILQTYFPLRFPSFWKRFDEAVALGDVVSTREVLNELPNRIRAEHLSEWIKRNKHMFLIPGEDETAFVAQILSVPHFHQIIGREALLRGRPVADPFVIACAAIRRGCVVTEESFKENAAKIPNVCQHFNVRCTDIEGFMNQQGWEF